MERSSARPLHDCRGSEHADHQLGGAWPRTATCNDDTLATHDILSRSILREVSIVVTPNYSALALLVVAAVPLCAQQDADAVLKSNCLPCHNVRNRSSGLALDSREA